MGWNGAGGRQVLVVTYQVLGVMWRICGFAPNSGRFHARFCDSTPSNWAKLVVLGRDAVSPPNREADKGDRGSGPEQSPDDCRNAGHLLHVRRVAKTSV